MVLQVEYALRLAPYFNIWCLDLKLCALSFSLTYKGILLLGIPLLLHIQPSSNYIHPQQALLASAPNPLPELQGLPNLPLFNSWLELFSFPATGGCQKPRLSHLHLSKPNRCQNQNHQTATKPKTAKNSQLTTRWKTCLYCLKF